jgi:sugar fermentation stimulation protein A
VEVKSATLASGPRGVAFPDSVTARGSKHLRELTAVVGAGDRAVLLFVCNRTGVDELRPADEIDPVYGYYLRQARTSGVEVLAYGCELDVTRPGMFATLAGPVTVRLPAFEYQPKLPATGRARVKRGAKKQVRLRPA